MANDKQEQASMKAIAAEAGVTLSTVSRILNNKAEKYAEATRVRVREIADRMKYRPNALVHAMQTGVTRTAGVMVPTEGLFHSQILTGIHESFLDRETLLLLSWNSRTLNKKDDTLERRLIHQLLDRRVDGVILRPSCEEFESSYFEEIWERNIPLILVDREMKNFKTDFAGTDDIAGGRTAAEHLIGLGHRRLLFIGVGEQVSTSRGREEGFRQVLSKTAKARGNALNFDEADAPQRLMEVLREPQRPTAICCYADPIAENVAKLVMEAGFSIPGDLSIMGFGNQQAVSEIPRLTSLDQKPFMIGQIAADMYFDRVYNKSQNAPQRRLIEPVLLPRASTSTPKAKAKR